MLSFSQEIPANLRETLRNHHKWIESNGEKGRRADLSGKDLSCTDLSAVNLQKAQLNGTRFWEATLDNADLRNVEGLSADQLAGARLAGAKLPEHIQEFDGLVQVEEIANRAAKLFASMLLGCVYSWLTIATTTDVLLLTNTAAFPLPIIGTEIPILGFYLAAPLILFSLYLWFHLYLQRLWDELAMLPAIFPDGKPLDRKVYPWLLTGFVRAHVMGLRRNRPPLSQLQISLCTVLTWWVVPLTFIPLWARYLPRHDWWGTTLHIAILSLSGLVAVFLHRLAVATVRGQKRKAVSLPSFRSPPDYRTVLLALAGVGLGGTLIYVLSLGSIDGVRVSFDVNALEDLTRKPPLHTELKVTDCRIWVPRLFALSGYSPFADLSEQEVSTKPKNWTGRKEKEEEELQSLKGARLKGIDLRYAEIKGAFLAKADFRKATLDEADMRESLLMQADFREANMKRTDLRNAQLRGANLSHTTLLKANLSNAQMRKATLERAVLTNADLSGVQLLEADLTDAQLSGANLIGAKLRKATMTMANLRGAHLVGAQLQAAELVGADLRQASLQKANLAKADLTEANLTDTHLEFANLCRTVLFGTDLTGAVGLTQAQLNEACVDGRTRLPVALTKPEPRDCQVGEQ